MIQPRKIYVTQYGYFWSFTPRQWRVWLQDNLPAIRAGEGYRLPDTRSILKRPATVGKDSDGDHAGYYACTNDIQLLEILDWYVEDWEQYLTDNPDLML